MQKKDTQHGHKKSQIARRYDREFRENAVALVRGGRTISSVARNFGGRPLGPWGRWVQLARTGGEQREPATLAAGSEEARELRRLRQENDHLRQQRDILGKKRWASVNGSASPRYPLTQKMNHEHPVAALWELFGILAAEKTDHAIR